MQRFTPSLGKIRNIVKGASIPKFDIWYGVMATCRGLCGVVLIEYSIREVLSESVTRDTKVIHPICNRRCHIFGSQDLMKAFRADVLLR